MVGVGHYQNRTQDTPDRGALVVRRRQCLGGFHHIVFGRLQFDDLLQGRAIPSSACHMDWMTDTTYRIVHREDDSFAVEVARSGVLPQTAAGFATEAEAEGWVAQDKRLWDSADPFRTPASRKWRGF
jgi:hypothetical protein